LPSHAVAARGETNAHRQLVGPLATRRQFGLRLAAMLATAMIISSITKAAKWARYFLAPLLIEAMMCIGAATV
jgi:hypothetical protein